MNITKEITIEELIETIPQSVKYLMERGIKCIACGEPIWGTLDDAAKEKGFSEKDIEKFISDLQYYHDNPQAENKSKVGLINTKKI